jgi:hypothetical protein
MGAGDGGLHSVRSRQRQLQAILLSTRFVDSLACDLPAAFLPRREASRNFIRNPWSRDHRSSLSCTECAGTRSRPDISIARVPHRLNAIHVF